MIAREAHEYATPVRIGVIGASWRAQYYFRIARELPERFLVTGVLVRSADSVSRVAAQWGFDATTSLDSFLRAGPYDFVVVSVPVEEAADLVRAVASAGIPVLVETPPASSLEA
ncbi:MAG: Gfo/Idh/MocA family oxidoreductase, partial [Salinibacterium sp.]|nr:Gfo/Idh/MocA family oxidoreductase [Salinibacterium sp.]